MMGKHCALGHIVDPQFRKDLGEDLPSVPAEKTILALDLEFLPSSRSHLVPPGTYRLELRVAAANSTPVTRILELTTTGEWFQNEDQMFTNGLGITVISTPSSHALHHHFVFCPVAAGSLSPDSQD
jgi:hypothetical protein